MEFCPGTWVAENGKFRPEAILQKVSHAVERFPGYWKDPVYALVKRTLDKCLEDMKSVWKKDNV